MDKTPGDKIIQEVSMPLAQAVFQKDFDAETGEALRAKTLELLLALDVLASASHDLAQISERSTEFKRTFEESFKTDFMKQSDYDDFLNYRTAEVQHYREKTNSNIFNPTSERSELNKQRRLQQRISGVSKVENGVITEVTIINPDSRSGNPTQAPFLPESHATETNKQSTFRDDSIRSIKEDIHNPLNSITTIERMGKKDGNPDTSLSKSFLMDSSFNGVLNDADKKAIGDYADKHKLTVQTSDKGTTDYMKTLSEKSDKNKKKLELEEQKRSQDIETETSKEEAPAAPATNGTAPTVMVTGGGGGGSFGGGGVFGGGGRQNASFGGGRRGGGDIKTRLENAEKEGEIDIDKLLSDMLEENKKEGENNTVEGVTSSLPEGTYSVVNGPDGKPLGYRVNEELGGGVFLFDSDSGKSTALMMTNKDNVFMDPETGKYYQMDFPSQPEDSSIGSTSENAELETAPTIAEIESDAEPIKKEVSLSSLDQDMLQDQGLTKTVQDGETFYSHSENGQITYMVDDSGKRVDQSIIDELNNKPRVFATEDASSSTFDIPPSLSEVFHD